MKYKFMLLASLVAIPSMVWATTNFLNTDPVYVISHTEREDIPISLAHSHHLQWNQAVGKFDLLPTDQHRPITLEESMLPLPVEPSANEPLYYDGDRSL